MRWPRLAIALVLLVAGPAAAQLPPGSYDVGEYRIAASTILCDCGCHPQSVADCACGRAAEMRDELAGLIAQGMSGEDVINLYVERHGEDIRIAPTATGFNLVAWLGPLVGLLLAALGVVLVLRRWTARATTEEPAPVTTATGDEPYRARLEQALEKFE